MVHTYALLLVFFLVLVTLDQNRLEFDTTVVTVHVHKMGCIRYVHKMGCIRYVHKVVSILSYYTIMT